MATTTACPSCGQKVAVPAGAGGGAVTCSNPACGKTFEAFAPGAGTPRPAKAPGTRPELLDRLPTSVFLSPPMIAVGGVVVLLYGMVLFGVVSARKNMPEAEEPVHETVAVAPIAPATTSLPETSTSKATESKAATPSKESAPGSKSQTAAKESVAKNKAPKSKEKGSKKTEIARNTEKVKEANVPPPEPPVQRQIEWGPLAGFPFDCQFRSEGPKLTIVIPGGVHLLSPDLKLKNSPLLLTEVDGDFTAQVNVPGRILPGTIPLPNFPITFQGAGLIVWQDENNYLRLERTAIFTAEKKRLNQVLVELCKEGKVASFLPRDTSDTDIALKFERRGSEVRCHYSPDGKTWLEVKRQSVSFPARVRVGVSASNASPKLYAARLEDFTISGPDVKVKKGP
jgi:regulation of enolase protein 1 (concanavalin A-like superfamily)